MNKRKTVGLQKHTVMKNAVIAGFDYDQFLSALKNRIQTARLSAARAVNCDLILLYWYIGCGIIERRRRLGWGESVVEMLARDLQAAFPGTRGFSSQNLWRMQQFYQTHTAEPFLSQIVREMGKHRPVAQNMAKLSQVVRELVAAVPWGHHANVLARVVDPAARLYYLRATPRFGWSRNVLLNQIKAGAYERAVTEKKTHNFPLALPKYLSRTKAIKVSLDY